MPEQVWQVERRTKLDGGLNARDASYTMQPDQVMAIQNFDLTVGGCLNRRTGAIIDPLLDQNVFTTNTSHGDTNAYTFVVTGAGGTIAAGTYVFKFVYHIRSGGQAPANNKIAANSTYSVVVAGGSSVIAIRVWPTNKGESNYTVATPAGTGLIDDPFMGGLVSGELEVYCQKSGSGDGFTLQAGGAIALTWDTTNGVWSYTLTAYTNNGATFPGQLLGQGPIRYIKFWKEFNRVFVLMMESLFCFNSRRFLAPVPLTTNNDSYGKKHYLSRGCYPPSMAFVSHVPIISDGYRCKKLSDNSVYNSDGSADVRLLGAQPPSATPTTSFTAGGVLNATYSYKITLVYQHNRPTGFPTSVASSGRATYQSESNSSLAIGPVSPVNQKVNIIYSNSRLSESGLFAVRVYRTQAGGTVFYKLADDTTLGGTYQDNLSDANLNTFKTTPDDPLKTDPCDLPPNQLLYLTEYLGYGFGVVGTQVVSTRDTNADRVIWFLGTNVIRISKLMLLSGQSEESTIDHWPNTVSYTVICGSTSRVTNLVSYQGVLYVFKEDEIGVIVGSQSGQFRYQTVYSGVGAVPFSCVVAQGLVYFFDENQGPYIFNGSSVDYVGLKLQYYWQVDKAVQYWVHGSFYNKFANQVHWYLTNMPTDPYDSQVSAGQGNVGTIRGTWKEYVFSIPTKGWTVFQGSSYARNVMAGCIIDQVQSAQSAVQLGEVILLGNTEGRMMDDNSAQTDNGTAITAFAEFPFFFGDPTIVKEWRQLMSTFNLAARTVGNILFKVKFSQDDNYGSGLQNDDGVVGVTAATTGDRTQVFDLPLNSSGTTIVNDRGLSMRVESTVDSAFTLLGLFIHWRDKYSGQKEVK